MTGAIREAVLGTYEAVGRRGSRSPMGEAIPTGAALARDLGYPATDLAAVPTPVLEAFVGAGAVTREVEGDGCDWVADLGCGAGVDALILARRGFRVIAIDAARSMLARLTVAARASGAGLVAPIRSIVPPIPLGDGTMGWVWMNGAANLVPDRVALLAEVHRVLRAGGVFVAADLFAIGPIPDDLRASPEAWAWCVGGATAPETWERDLAAAGFGGVRIEIAESLPPLGRGTVRAVNG